MMMFLAHEFALRWNRIETCLAHIQMLAAGEKGNRPLQPTDFITLQPTINDLNYLTTMLMLDKSMHQLGQLEDTLSGKPCNFHMVDSLLESIMQTIHQETDEVILAFIPH